MTGERANLRAAAALVDNLAAAGLRDVCISPGSRSAPLALAIAAQPRLRRHVITDERDAGFFALGIARATGVPAAVLCTSGTAAANYAPAVAEASRAGVPLIVLTADRPTELRDSGAAQTISQPGLFGAHACWSVDAAVPDESWPYARYFAALACRAFAAARRSRAPVHLNIPLREPLWSLEEWETLMVRREDALPPRVHFERADARIGATAVEELAARLRAVQRGLLVCGPGSADVADAEVFVDLACSLGWPLLADPSSGLRFGALRCDGAERVVVDAYDVLLRSPQVRRTYRPDVVLRFGALPTSKVLVRFLADDCAAHQIAVWPASMWADPDFVVAEVLESEPAVLAAALRAEIGRSRQPLRARSAEQRGTAAAGPVATARSSSGECDGASAGCVWPDAWTAAQAAVRVAMARWLAGATAVFEGAIAAALVDALPDGTTLFVGNSLPVRAVDTFAPATERRIRVLANRGANGIDGVTATALGAAAVSDGPCVLFTGDLSFLHDIGALQIAHRHRISLTIVVANNDGGGIFSFLPRPPAEKVFEELFATPHGLSPARAVEMCGGTHVAVTSCDELARAVKNAIADGGLKVVEIATERERTVEQQRACIDLAIAELDGLTRGRS